jgi:adenylosuccinate synthase
MPSTSIVVDLGFGDAGKGTIVDALSRRCSSPPLVVRHNGGAQAGHNVHTPDGRHHTFSQFGSATFLPGAWTLLSEHMILHPQGLLAERAHLVALGVEDPLLSLIIDERALVITPFQQATNRLREAARGDKRHGTCGIGVGETVADSFALGADALRARDLRDRTVLRRKLSLIRERKREEVAALFGDRVPQDVIMDIHVLESASVIDQVVDWFADIGAMLKIFDQDRVEHAVRTWEHVIFEGAQGVLLDEWHGFHPHTTWSTTTTKNANEMITIAGREGPVRKIGVVRAYATRHGQGPFPTEDAVLGQMLRESHNTDTGWQGEFRVGWFDLPLTRYALDACPDIKEIAVTCLDRVASLPEWRFCEAYDVPADAGARFVMGPEGGTPCVAPPGDLAYQEQLGCDLWRCDPILESIDASMKPEGAIEHLLGLPVKITSHGPTAADKRFVE